MIRNLVSFRSKGKKVETKKDSSKNNSMEETKAEQNENEDTKSHSSTRLNNDKKFNTSEENKKNYMIAQAEECFTPEQLEVLYYLTNKE